jgi:hypothetical protein
VQTLGGLERSQALPRWRCSDEAVMPRVGCQAPQGRQGIGQRGASPRPGERAPGPSGPETLAQHRVPWHLRALEAVCQGAMRACATAGVVGQQGTGLADGTALETTARDPGGGQVTRPGRLEDTRGPGHAREGTVDGWHVRRRSEAVSKMPWAVQVGPRQAQEARWARALVTHARAKLARLARLAKVVLAKGWWAGPTRGWLDQQGRRVVGPAHTPLAGAAAARAQAAAGADRTVGRRVHTVRPGPGQAAWPERLATAVGGITGLTPAAPDGTPEPARQAKRRAGQATPINAVVVRTWRGQDDGPGGTPGLRTKALVEKPRRVLDDDADRRRRETCGLKEAKQPGDLGHPPPKPDRAVRVHGLCTRLRFALATASRLPYARKARGEEPVGWQRWRRQLLEPNRAQVSVLAQGYDGIVHVAESSWLWGARLKDVPPGLGTLQKVLAHYGLTKRGSPLCWNLRNAVRWHLTAAVAFHTLVSALG